jgi:hypothetical protein
MQKKQKISEGSSGDKNQSNVITDIHVSKGILAANSKYFHTMFLNWIDEKGAETEINEANPELFVNLIQLMYTKAFIASYMLTYTDFGN